MVRKLAALLSTAVGLIWCALVLWKSSFDPYTVLRLCPGVGLIASGALIWWLPRTRPRAAARAFILLWSLLGGAFLWSVLDRSNDLVVEFASRSVRLSSDSDAESAADRARIAFRVCGEVVSLTAPLVESPSILGARYRAKIVLDEPARVADWQGRSFEFRYDKYGLGFGAPQRGDQLCFYFEADGNFLDVLPAWWTLEFEGAEQSR